MRIGRNAGLRDGLASLGWLISVVFLPMPLIAQSFSAPGSSPKALDSDTTHFIRPWESPANLGGEWRYAKGDSLAWADSGYDDAHWRKSTLKQFGAEDMLPGRGNAWFRIRLNLVGPVDSSKSLAIGHFPLNAMEFYWDGVLVGRSGRVGGSLAEEEPGRGVVAYLPQDRTGPGEHVLAIRISSHHPFTFVSPYILHLGDATALENRRYRESMVMIFLAGIFLTAAIFRYFNYLAAGFGRSSILFSVSVISCAGFILLNVLPQLAEMGANSHLVSRAAMAVFWYLMICLVPDYFIFADAFPFRRVLPVLLLGGLIFLVPMGLLFTGLVPFHWWQAVYHLSHLYTFIAIGVSIWIIAWAAKHRQVGSGTALFGLILLMVGVFATFSYDVYWGWSAGVAAHIVCLARAQSLKITERVQQHNADQLKAARLEIELLKKNIQPHFLLNSLNSIIAWLEEEPQTAVRLVKALEQELHLLLRISAEQTISLEEEINLCKLHLQVMGLRQDKHYEFWYEGEGQEDRLPPMVLHTLVENGITHGYQGRKQGVFRLTRELIPGGIRYSLHNDGTTKEKGLAQSHDLARGGKGTGLRYVRTRLEEAFPGRWKLDSRAVTDGWRVDLEVRT
jgi:Histidine kinase